LQATVQLALFVRCIFPANHARTAEIPTIRDVRANFQGELLLLTERTVSFYSWHRRVQTFGSRARVDVQAETRARVLCAVDRWMRSSWTDTLSSADTGQLGTTTPRCRADQRRRWYCNAAVSCRALPRRSRNRRGRSGRVQPCFVVDRGTDSRSLRLTETGPRPRRRWPRHAVLHAIGADEDHPIDRQLLPLSLLLTLSFVCRVLSSMCSCMRVLLCLF